MITQLIDVTFEDKDGRTLLVVWYHVPRIGDHVEISEPIQMVGKVVSVTWTESAVWVRIK